MPLDTAAAAAEESMSVRLRSGAKGLCRDVGRSENRGEGGASSNVVDHNLSIMIEIN